MTNDTLAKLAAKLNSYRMSPICDNGSEFDLTLRDAVAALTAQALPAAEPVTRFCPGCGYVGEVEAKYRDCCPDGSGARMIPESLARKCHDLFALAIKSACTTPQAAQQAAQATAGWVLVPVEPTTEMVEAGNRARLHREHGDLRKAEVLSARTFNTQQSWAAMIAAALPQPQPQSAQAKGDA